MRQLIERLQHEIEAFIEQRQSLILLIEARQEDAPIVSKLMTEIEKSNQTDIFLVLLADFETPEQYANAAVEQLATQHKIVCDELARRGEPSLPPLPTGLEVVERPAIERLQDVIRATRALVPSDGGHRLVVILWPMAVAQPEQFVGLCRTLLKGPSLPDWASGTRLIIREVPGIPHELAAVLPAHHIKRARSDFSPPALKRCMEEVAADPGQSQTERMQALLMLATLEHAADQPTAAIEKYKLLLSYYQETQNPTMQAVVLNHMGEVYHRKLQLGEARHYYESALVPTEQSPAPLLILILARNLGDVAFLQGNYSDALACYSQWHLVSERLEDGQSQVAALQKLGLTHQKLGDHAAAIASYEAAAQRCRVLDIPGMDREHMEPLRQLYAQRGQHNPVGALARRAETTS